MHTVTFHNLGNADCIRINLENGKKILFDYANLGDCSDDSDLRCDLPSLLRKDLGDREYFDVVAFTHLDEDHHCGATNFFYFDHVSDYQDKVDGKKRIKMIEIWVPAAVITEPLARNKDTAEARAIQKEARERFKAGCGVRVFSLPQRLKDWCRKNGVSFEDRRRLITDAGNVVPGFSKALDGVEFFVHSPFAKRQDENDVVIRNEDAIVMHATFLNASTETRLFLTSDVDYELLADIVSITEGRNRPERLEWDLFKLPHHCSYKSLSDEKGRDKTKPEATISRLFEQYAEDKCIIVSTSDTIPEKGDARDTLAHANPPHRQAANYYKDDVSGPKDGEFIATMEHPSESRPAPLVIEIDSRKATVKKKLVSISAGSVAARAPRAGSNRGEE